MKPAFVFFDIGGVVIKDFSCTDKWNDFKEGLGLKANQFEAFENYWDQEIHPRVNLDLDIDSRVTEFNTKFQLNLPNNFSILNEFIIRFNLNPSLWLIIQQLITSNNQIGLLTNMYPRMLTAITEANLLPVVKWDVIIDSSVEKVQKPNPAIYKLAQQKADVPHQEILFIDNTQKHLDAAKKIGWQTLYYNSCDYINSTQKLKQYIQV